MFCIRLALPLQAMKKLLAVISALLVLGAAVPGCRHALRYDGRLTAADSLMKGDADSALAMLETLPSSDLHTGRDSAYRDLLLTQARYKAYVTATSDSDINRALAWFRAHPADREKLTRAYIYKGAVMDELGHPDSAMLYYKHAEATADKKDYVNLGQINTRIAALYRSQYADFLSCYEIYNKALRYYQLTGNKSMQQNCYYNLGLCAGIMHHDDASKLLRIANDLAVELNDSAKSFECKELMSRQLINVSLSEAKVLALDLLLNYKKYVNNDLLLDLADIYAQENILDSAKYYISFVDEKFSLDRIEQIKIRKYEILSIIAKSDNNFSESDSYNDSASLISKRILNNSVKYEIKRIDNQNKKEQFNKVLKDYDFLKMSIIIVLIFVILITILVYRFAKLYFRIRNINLEITKQGIAEPDAHEELLERIHEQDNLILHFITNTVDLMKTSIKATTTKKRISLENRIKSTMKNVASDEFWTELGKHLDNDHNNLISRIAKTNKLNEKELRFIELECLGFSYIEIAITLNYSPNYISKKRKIIAEKLGLDESLEEYIKSEMSKI